MKMKMYMMKMEMIMTKWLTNGGHMIVDHMDRRKWIAYGETVEHMWQSIYGMDVLNVDMQKKCSYERVFFFLFAIWIFQFLVRPP